MELRRRQGLRIEEAIKTKRLDEEADRAHHRRELHQKYDRMKAHHDRTALNFSSNIDADRRNFTQSNQQLEIHGSVPVTRLEL